MDNNKTDPTSEPQPARAVSKARDAQHGRPSTDQTGSNMQSGDIDGYQAFIRQQRPKRNPSEQREFLDTLTSDHLVIWLQSAFLGKTYPVQLSRDDDPGIFVWDMYRKATPELAWRLKAALVKLARDYKPVVQGPVYLDYLAYACGKLRVTEAYNEFVDLLFNRVFQGTFADDRLEEIGKDVHTSLIQATAALRPSDDDRVLVYCRKVLEEDPFSPYFETAFRVLWKAYPQNAPLYFVRFMDYVASLPEEERYEAMAFQLDDIEDRYGRILDSHCRASAGEFADAGTIAGLLRRSLEEKNPIQLLAEIGTAAGVAAPHESESAPAKVEVLTDQCTLMLAEFQEMQSRLESLAGLQEKVTRAVATIEELVKQWQSASGRMDTIENRLKSIESRILQLRIKDPPVVALTQDSFGQKSRRQAVSQLMPRQDAIGLAPRVRN